MHQPKLIGEELAQLKEQRVQKTDLERVLEVNDGTGMLDEDEEESDEDGKDKKDEDDDKGGFGGLWGDNS